MNNSTGTRPDPIAHLIAGGLAGFFTSILVHPLDVIRTRMQVHTGPGSRYSGVLDGLRTTVRTDGWRGLYAGLTPSLVGSGISWGLFMFFYDTFKHQNADLFGACSITHVISAAEAGMLTATLTNPIWLVKTRLELQSRQLPNLSRPAAIPYLGLVDCLKRIAREEGVLALYRGLVPSLWMCSHGAIQFTAYEALKSSVWLRDTTSMFSPSDSAHTFVLAGLAKMTAATATFPLSTVRSRIQEKPLDGSAPLSLWQMSVKMMRHEGPRGFFKGLTPCLLRVTPHSAAMFVLYEKFLTVFTSMQAQLK